MPWMRNQMEPREGMVRCEARHRREEWARGCRPRPSRGQRRGARLRSGWVGEEEGGCVCVYVHWGVCLCYVCMLRCVLVYLCVYVHLCVYVGVHLHVCVCVCVGVYGCVYLCVYVYLCVEGWLLVCILVCVC